ncbi:MAG: pilus assembly PilX N-terminal domain-containing protein [Patescibacteria group bacterium]
MTRQKLNQYGVVSLTVSVVIMIVLSLIVISFARIMRREQEQSLDRQLNTQAFYAAETAVNDAKAELARNPLYSKNDCDINSGEALSVPSIGDDDLVSFACVTVDQEPDDIIVPVDTERSTVFELAPVNSSGNPAAIDRINITWNAPGNTSVSAIPTGSDLPEAGGSWGSNVGVVRLQITPINSSVSLTRDLLAAETRVLYLRPASSGGNTSWPILQDLSTTTPPLVGGGEITLANCTVGGDCSVSLDSIPSGANYTYMIRLTSVYQPNNVTVQAENTASPTPISFTGVQAVVDATGKANDVLRRIEERIPLQQYYDFPEYAIDVGLDLCKQLEAIPTSVTTSRPESSCQP